MALHSDTSDTLFCLGRLEFLVVLAHPGPLAQRSKGKSRVDGTCQRNRSRPCCESEVLSYESNRADISSAQSLSAPQTRDKVAQVALAKLHATQTAVCVVSEVQATLGASAMLDTNPLEKVTRDLRMYAVLGGLNEVCESVRV